MVGFLEHDLFKSGVAYDAHTLSAIAGLNGLLITRDKQRHGSITLGQPFQ